MVVIERGRGCPRLEQRKSTSGGAGCFYAGRRSEAEQQRRGETGNGDGETMQRRGGTADERESRRASGTTRSKDAVAHRWSMEGGAKKSRARGNGAAPWEGFEGDEGETRIG